MADNVDFQASTLATPASGTKVSTDDAGASGHVQRVKLALSADGSAAHATVDADGVLVNLGANNDVTVTGTVTATPSGDHTVVGKAADGAAVSGNPVLMAGQDGTNVQSLKTDASGELQVDVLTLPALAAGTNNIGDVDVLSVPAPLSTTGGGTEATALRVTVATDSTGVLSVDDNGSTLSVDDGAGSLTVDNAALAVTGGGVEASALRVTLASDSTGVVSVDDNGGSLTVDVGTALPAGTNNIGDVDVLSLVPGTTATSLGKAEDAAHTTGDTGVMVLGVRNDAGTTLAGTDGDYIPLSVDSAGAVRVTGGGGGVQYTEADTDASITGTAVLWEDASDTLRAVSTAKPLPVNIISGAGSGGTAMQDDTAFTPGTSNVTPAGATFDDTTPDSVDEGDIGALRMSANRNLYATIRDAAGNERGLNIDASGRIGITDGSSSLTVDNGGTFATQVDGAALTALQLIDDTIFADDAAFTVGTSKVSAIGAMADETSTDSVDEGDVGVPRMTLDRKVIVNDQPHSAGGLSIFRSLDLDESEEEVKGTAGCVYGAWVTNTATSTRWLKFYNATAANVTVGTTTPVITLGIPGNSSDDVSAVLNNGGKGVTFDTAITVAATTGVADADTGAPAANDVIVNVFYK